MEITSNILSYLFNTKLIAHYDYVVHLSGRCINASELWYERYSTPNGVTFTTKYGIFDYVSDIAQTYIQPKTPPAKILIEDLLLFSGCETHDLVESLIEALIKEIGAHATEKRACELRRFILLNIDIHIFTASNNSLLARTDVIDRIKAKYTLSLSELRNLSEEVDKKLGFSAPSLTSYDIADNAVVEIWGIVYLRAVKAATSVVEQQQKRSYSWIEHNGWSEKDLKSNIQTIPQDSLLEECRVKLGDRHDIEGLFHQAISRLVACRKITYVYNEDDIPIKITFSDESLSILPSIVDPDVWGWFKHTVDHSRRWKCSIKKTMIGCGYLMAKPTTGIRLLGEVAEWLADRQYLDEAIIEWPQFALN